MQLKVISRFEFEENSMKMKQQHDHNFSKKGKPLQKKYLASGEINKSKRAGHSQTSNQEFQLSQ